MLTKTSCFNAIIKLALREDVGNGDITAKLIPNKLYSSAQIISRQNAILCGTFFVNWIFDAVDNKIKIKWLVRDSDNICKNQVLCEIYGPTRSLLTAERTAINFLQTLSCTATLTNKFIQKIKATNVKLLDTRKTIPGLRLAQKYAVLCGGGCNHRFGLYDAILIKENHIAACGNITNAVNKARQLYKRKNIEVEVRNLDELKEAIATPANIIMLDNFCPKLVSKAIEINNSKKKIEVSGNINLNNIIKFAKTGVDYISVGSITKTIMPIDLSMLIKS